MNYFAIIALLLSFMSVPSLPTHLPLISTTAIVTHAVVDTMPKQITCMADAIYYEAKSEPYTGRLAVGIVVLNRVNHPEFPKSVCDVVYQRSSKGCQFSWVCEHHRIAEPELYLKAEEIAKKILYDHARLHAVRHALFFHNTSVSPSWDDDMQLVLSTGDQLFYATKRTEK